IVKPRFYYNPLTRRAPFVNAYIHSKSFPADNPYLSALVHGVAGNAGKVWMSASSVDTGIRGMISVQQNSSFRPLVKKFIMRDGVLGMGVVGDMSALSRYPVLNTLVSGAALYNNKPYFHAMAPDVSDFMVGPGVIVVRSLAPIKTVVIVPDTNMSFDFSAFEERIRVFLARSVPEEKDVILPDGSKARQLRASDKVFQWIGSDATLATGEKVVIRSLPDNPGDIHFAYARVQTQPSVLVFAPDPRDISETLPLINVFSQAIEQARAYPESVDAFFSPDSVPKAFAPYLQGVKSFHVYQRSAQSEILFDIESYNRD
ncbi:MAG TPA: hypothetical protein VJB93_03885, partial [Patescibacteria group bacterium]|nr:hypothetical protein [Patescibacteria group bacterium]